MSFHSNSRSASDLLCTSYERGKKYLSKPSSALFLLSFCLTYLFYRVLFVCLFLAVAALLPLNPVTSLSSSLRSALILVSPALPRIKLCCLVAFLTTTAASSESLWIVEVLFLSSLPLIFLDSPMLVLLNIITSNKIVLPTSTPVMQFPATYFPACCKITH